MSIKTGLLRICCILYEFWSFEKTKILVLPLFNTGQGRLEEIIDQKMYNRRAIINTRCPLYSSVTKVEQWSKLHHRETK